MKQQTALMIWVVIMVAIGTLIVVLGGMLMQHYHLYLQ
jgi:hypothetical protein